MNKTYRIILENTYVLSIKGRDKLFPPRGERSSIVFASFNPYCWFSHDLQCIRSRKDYLCGANPSAPATPLVHLILDEDGKSMSQMMLL